MKPTYHSNFQESNPPEGFFILFATNIFNGIKMRYGKKGFLRGYIISLREIGCLPHLLSQL
jgi:hypothetical protein